MDQPRRTPRLFLLRALALAALLLALLCAASPDVPPAWPRAEAPLSVLALPAPDDAGPRRKPRIYIDPGHGTGGNFGNTSSTCEKEEEFNARAARQLFAGLAATGRFELKLARKEGQVRSYPARVREAEAWHADALISLHSDCRGAYFWGETDAGQTCPVSISHDAAGFAVLFSDEDPALAEGRRELARALSRRMAEAGFLPYDGYDYVPFLYGADEVPGAFVDRHTPGRRIYMLRRPRLASVIVETHHAWDPDERERWDEPRTLEAFTAAVAAAVLDLKATPAPARPRLASAALPDAGR